MRALAVLVMLALATPSTAEAQTRGWVDLTKAGADAQSGFGTRGDAIDVLALQPLRLGLLGSYVPHASTDAFSLCRGTKDPTETSLAFRLAGPSPAWSERRASGTPRLSLFGTTRDGCPIDGGIGGGAMVTMQLTQNTFFVLSGGAIYLPQGLGPRTAPQGRADLVFRGEGGRSLGIGVGYQGNGARLSVGGTW